MKKNMSNRKKEAYKMLIFGDGVSLDGGIIPLTILFLLSLIGWYFEDLNEIYKMSIYAVMICILLYILYKILKIKNPPKM